MIEEVRQCSCCGRTVCAYDSTSEELIEKSQTFHAEGLSKDKICFRLYRWASNQMQGYLGLDNCVQLPHCAVENVSMMDPGANGSYTSFIGVVRD